MRARLCVILVLSTGWAVAQPAPVTPVPNVAPSSIVAPATTAAPATVAAPFAPPSAAVTTAPATVVAAAPKWAPDDVVVLVHGDNPVQSIKRADLASMYLGQRKTWAHGKMVKVVRRAASSRAGELCDAKVLDMSRNKFRQYWQRKELAGQGIAPRTVGSAGQLLRVVRSDAGAVGCISGAEAAQLPAKARARAVTVILEE